MVVLHFENEEKLFRLMIVIRMINIPKSIIIAMRGLMCFDMNVYFLWGHTSQIFEDLEMQWKYLGKIFSN